MDIEKKIKGTLFHNDLTRLPFKYYGVYKIVKNEFWFVDIPRTSSSSIRKDLGEKFGIPYTKTKILGAIKAFKDHRTAIQMRNLLGKDNWENLFTFTFVRNPWDRTFSMYHYRRKTGTIPASMHFNDYVYELFKAHTSSSDYFHFPRHYLGAADFVLNESGEIIVDFIGKYENRREDLKRIEEEIGVDNIGSDIVRNLTPEGAKYHDHYTQETREIIEEIYQKDIQLFEYEF